MAKSLTQPSLAADKAIHDAIRALLATYNQTKQAGDYGVMTWDKAEKLLLQAAMRKNRRGNTGFRGDTVLTVTP
jgi:hypothetical protein